MVYILVNPKSGGEKAGDLKKQVLALPEFQGKEGETRDVTELGEYVPFLKGLAAEDEVVFVGGDDMTGVHSAVSPHRPGDPAQIQDVDARRPESANELIRVLI